MTASSDSAARDVYKTLAGLETNVDRRAIEFRIIVVGDQKTGKTAFVEKLLFKANQTLYFSTILDFYTGSGVIEYSNATRTLGMKKYAMTMLDCSGMSI